VRLGLAGLKLWSNGGNVTQSNRPEARLLMALFAATVMLCPEASQAQIRSPYSPGLNSTNSGTLPDPGLTYSNFFQRYSFNQLKGPDGERLPVSGNLSVTIDHNLLMWTTEGEILGAKFAVVADLPVIDSSLNSPDFGPNANSGGFADSFFQPFTLGWSLSRADILVGYGFTPPTGRFEAEAAVNVNSGFWSHSPFAGQTVYLTKDKKTAASAYEMYEFHGKQKDTDIKLGQTFDIDYSIMRALTLKKDEILLQIGAVGYGQYQTTDDRGPGVDPVIAEGSHYKVQALGPGANVILPQRKVSLGVRYFKEFGVVSSVQGQSVQIFTAITF